MKARISDIIQQFIDMSEECGRPLPVAHLTDRLPGDPRGHRLQTLQIWNAVALTIRRQHLNRSRTIGRYHELKDWCIAHGHPSLALKVIARINQLEMQSRRASDILLAKAFMTSRDLTPTLN